MRTVRFYCETIEQTSVLDSVESHHLSRVLRLPVGAAVELFDGHGTLAKGIVETITRQQVTLRTDRIEQNAPRQQGRIILAVSFAKGQRFDWLVEKCTELGVDHIAAVQFERTVKLGKASSVQRLEKITLSAAKQSGRLFLPVLTGPEKLKATVKSLQSRYPACQFIYGDPEATIGPDIMTRSTTTDTAVLIGPEGGFTEDETNYLNSLNATPVRINDHVLRVETAATAFCSLLAHQRTV